MEETDFYVKAKAFEPKHGSSYAAISPLSSVNRKLKMSVSLLNWQSIMMVGNNATGTGARAVQSGAASAGSFAGASLEKRLAGAER